MPKRSSPARAAASRPPQAVQPSEEAQVFDNPHLRGQRQVAGGEADLGHGLRPMPGQPVTEDLDLARVWPNRTEAHQQCCRLSGTVGTEHRDPFPDADREINTVDRSASPILLHQSFGAQREVALGIHSGHGETSSQVTKGDRQAVFGGESQQRRIGRSVRAGDWRKTGHNRISERTSDLYRTDSLTPTEGRKRCRSGGIQ